MKGQTRKMNNITKPHSTVTIRGAIPHLKVVTDTGIVWAPVCVEAVMVANERRFIPVRNEDGRYLYALPGGGRLVGK